VRKVAIVLASLTVLGLLLYFSGFIEGFMMRDMPDCYLAHHHTGNPMQNERLKTALLPKRLALSS
jgi:hypothetical protein